LIANKLTRAYHDAGRITTAGRITMPGASRCRAHHDAGRITMPGVSRLRAHYDAGRITMPGASRASRPRITTRCRAHHDHDIWAHHDAGRITMPGASRCRAHHDAPLHDLWYNCSMDEDDISTYYPQKLCTRFMTELERLYGQEFADNSKVVTRSGWYTVWLAFQDGQEIIPFGDMWKPLRRYEFMEVLFNLINTD
jgi:hypothetical protein